MLPAPHAAGLLALLAVAAMASGCEEREPDPRGVTGEPAASGPPIRQTEPVQAPREPTGPPPAPDWGSRRPKPSGAGVPRQDPSEPASGSERRPAERQTVVVPPPREPGPAPADGEREAEGSDGGPTTLCMWFAYGRKEFLCMSEPLEKARKRCGERVRAQLGESARCSCSDDPSYVGDMCEGL